MMNIGQDYGGYEGKEIFISKRPKKTLERARPARSSHEACSLMLRRTKKLIITNQEMLKNEKEMQKTMKNIKTEFEKCNTRRQDCAGLKKNLLLLQSLENKKKRLTDVNENHQLAAIKYSRGCDEKARRTDSEIYYMDSIMPTENAFSGNTTPLANSPNALSSDSASDGNTIKTDPILVGEKETEFFF